MDLDQALLVERHEAEWMRTEGVVPGAEVHDDADVTWIVQPGAAWGNAGVMVRFAPDQAAGRLDTLVARYRAHGRGMGLWISPAATPADLPQLLRARRLHCRKHFPAMVRRLTDCFTPRCPAGLEIRPVTDMAEFEEFPHPSIGPITTERRRYARDAMNALLALRPQRVWPFVGWLHDRPVGASLLFVGEETSGLHDLTVREEHRGQGIGAALLEHTCREAARHGAATMVLLATSDGQRVYERCGFAEVARFGYWYRSFQQGAR